MKKLVSQILAATLGLWLATIFVDGVVVETFADSKFLGFSITTEWQIFLALGIILGLLNYFIGPILKSIALPLQIITFGFFSFVINAGFIWILDYIFDELQVPWMWPLIWTTLIIWALNLLISKILIKNEY
jgi:putative membrane protein